MTEHDMNYDQTLEFYRERALQMRADYIRGLFAKLFTLPSRVLRTRGGAAQDTARHA